MFDVETQRAMSRHIQWTRHVRDRRTTDGGTEVEILRYIADHRESLVLKPAGGFGGEGVVVGKYTDQGAWEHTLSLAVRRPYVVQELVVPVAEPYPLLVDGGISEHVVAPDFNPFVWNGTSAGGVFIRLSQTIHNLAVAGTTAPVFTLA